MLGAVCELTTDVLDLVFGKVDNDYPRSERSANFLRNWKDSKIPRLLDFWAVFR